MEDNAYFPWQRILEFTRGVVPFQNLSAEDLEEMVSSMEIGYFPRGKVIIEKGGEPSRYLYIIQNGSAKVTLPGEDGEEDILVDIRGEGDTFGVLSLLEGKRALFQVTAREDLICYQVPGLAIREIIERNPALRDFFSSSLARNLAAVRRSAACELPLVPGLEPLSEPLNLGAALVKSQVGDLMEKNVLTCPPATSIREAARLMTAAQVGSIVVVDETGHPEGILTDTDFRVKVMLRGRSFEQRVADFITPPLYTIPPESYAFQALLDMSRHGVHHLVVTRDDKVAGIISDRDLQALTGSSPVGVVREIEKVESVEDLVDLHVRIDRVLELLLKQGGSARDMLELVTEFNDRLTLKLLELTEEGMDDAGLGRAPVPYTWMALGSEGRREQTLRTDQDNALIFANIPAEREEPVKAWFLEFGRRMADALERCGFPRCQGGVMAMNPQWCRTESQWIETFLGWVADPNPRTLRLASIFFDFRAIYAEADHLEALTEHLKVALEENRLFLRYMAKNGLYNRPPLGFLRQFVVSKGGEHNDQLNLKLGGLTPIVDAVRVMALDQGVLATGTLDRLAEITRRGLLKADQAADIEEAFSFITLLRIRRHLEARAHGEVPDNYLDPAKLNNLQRKTLKESFRVINSLQDLLEHRYQTWLVT